MISTLIDIYVVISLINIEMVLNKPFVFLLAIAIEWKIRSKPATDSG